jgi:two-component system, OmpR family, response regulator VicR
MNKRIIIIDDDQDARKLLQFILTSNGFIAEVYSDGTGLAVLIPPYPDLYLLDINLGNTSGLELCKQLKANESTRHIPVIITSSNTDIIPLAQDACADDTLPKPFDSKELISKIIDLTTKRHR